MVSNIYRLSAQKAIWVAVLSILFLGCLFLFLLRVPYENDQAISVIINTEISNSKSIGHTLASAGLIRGRTVFNVASMIVGSTRQGSVYYITPGRSVWDIAKLLYGESNMKSITIPEGLRKEQIAYILQDALHWPAQDAERWVTDYTAMRYDYVEGVYFPDTYLIPIDESPLALAERLQRRFDEVYAPYIAETLERNIQWTTIVTIASLIQREAAGTDDMSLISGIIWNRLERDMPLEIDATVQYARDTAQYNSSPSAFFGESATDNDQGWWDPIQESDKNIESPYNTYQHTGLPPHPIANPGVDALVAALHPQSTSCIYYLHDLDGDIHCAESRADHEANVVKYLH